jgi:hypothetical protein
MWQDGETRNEYGIIAVNLLENIQLEDRDGWNLLRIMSSGRP